MSTLAIRKKVLAELFRNGRGTAEQLVEDARASGHPLHNDFDWNDTRAAHRWRMQQAREIIRSVEFTIKYEHIRIASCAYVRDPAAPSHVGGYVSMEKVRTEEDLALDVVEAEIARVVSAYQRAASVASVLNMKGQLDRAVEAAMALSAEVKARKKRRERATVQ